MNGLNPQAYLTTILLLARNLAKYAKNSYITAIYNFRNAVAAAFRSNRIRVRCLGVVELRYADPINKRIILTATTDFNGPDLCVLRPAP